MKTLLIIALGLLVNLKINAEVPSYESGSQVFMKKALPVWAEGRETEMNLTLGFCSTFQIAENKKINLRITASTMYRVFINGKFLGYGPARASHSYFRMDDYELSKYVRKGENSIAVEVAGYNVNSYYTLDQPSFLQMELEADGKIVMATGSDKNIEAFQIKERLQKVERYSFQRPFTEYYRLAKDFDLWKVSAKIPGESLKLKILPSVKLLHRNLLIPDFNLVRPVSVCSKGTIGFKIPENYYNDRSLTKISDKFKGFKENELEVLPSQIIQEIVNKTQDTLTKPFDVNGYNYLGENGFTTYDFGIDLSGFIGAKLSCKIPTKLIFYFDELLTGGDVNTKKRMRDVNDQIVCELEPGDYNFESFEPYTFGYLKMIVLKGSCRIQDVYLREYAYPENAKASFTCSNNKLNEIYKAARQSFRQNAVDILTDCPSRERAGWLCDSYFSAIMEKDFTGHSAVTRNFYENYALPESFANLPEGMIPMCYPADHPDGVFIPNWAMWFVIQVNDYAQRGGDPILIARLKPRVEGVLNYFSKFENEDGLLENLQSWIFVEWSKANNFVLDVNYPTNMLYSSALANAADLYHNDTWHQKSERIRKMILQQSFNGTFFVDNAVRKMGKLEVTTNTTEVCQYYAFFFNLVSPQSHPALWKKLITDFGPKRDDAVMWPKVFRANAFIGNYIRMDILSRYGLKAQLVNEIQDYFYPMTQKTGTLWENMDSGASCNHGFASYLGHAIYRDILGISQIDYLRKEINIQFTDIDLNECSGAIPINDNSVGLKWKRFGNQIRYSVNVPSGFKVNIENLSKSTLVKSE